MNFLAHVFLSGNDKQLQVGNFIGDYVKGSSYTKYSARIAQGILLHRAIDDFTDKHPKVMEAKHLLQPSFRLYSGIFVDMFYDHFLASQWQQLSPVPLKRFTRRFYKSMVWHFRILPPRVKGFLPHLIASNRLSVYATVQGLQHSLEIMENYTSLPHKSQEAVALLEQNYEWFKENFNDFFPQLQEFAAAKILELAQSKARY